jgi:hypothetical protein
MRAAMLQSGSRGSSLYRRRKKKATADVCFVKLVQKEPVPSQDNVNHLTSCTQAVLRTKIFFPRHRRAQKSRISIVFFILIRPNEQKSCDVLELQEQTHISLHIFLTARLLCAAMKKKKPFRVPPVHCPIWCLFRTKPLRGLQDLCGTKQVSRALLCFCSNLGFRVTACLCSNLLRFNSFDFHVSHNKDTEDSMQICTALFCQNYVSQTCTSLCFEISSFLEHFLIVECHVRRILEVC